MLEKNGIDVSFAQGLDTKTDPRRVPIGKFLSLENQVFTKAGRLQKRYGFAQTSALPTSNYKYVTTFKDNLTAVDKNIAAYNAGNSTWVQKGSFLPLSISTLPVIRNNYNQTSVDIAVSSSGTACAVYVENNNGVNTNKYCVFDANTGQNIVAPAVIPVASGAVSGGMRVFVLGNYFIMVFTNTITAVDHLQYVAVTIATPTTVSANTDIIAAYRSAPTNAWDGCVDGTKLFIAYAVSTTTKINYLTSSLVLGTQVSFAQSAEFVSVTVDTTAATHLTYVTSGTAGNASSVSVDPTLVFVMTKTDNIVDGNEICVTSSAQSGSLTVFYGRNGGPSLGFLVEKRVITAPVSPPGVGTVTVQTFSIINGCLASKSFIMDSVIYVLVATNSPFQPTYFLLNGSTSSWTSPQIVSKLAYGNGGGVFMSPDWFFTSVLPSVTISSTTARFAYRFKDLIEAVNKGTNLATGSQTGGIYSQTGLNLAKFVFSSDALNSSEIGNDLHLSGGLLWMYDGYLPVEHNFLLWPEGLTATWNASSVVTPTGTFSAGTRTVVVSSATGVYVGMTITDTTNPTYIPAGTTITSINGTTLTISAFTVNAGAGDSLSISGNIAAKPDGSTNTSAYFYQATYEWSDNQGNAFRSSPSIPLAVTTTGTGVIGSISVVVPYLNFTMKTANPVKIVLYRWSVAQQNYYQVTSITAPVANDTSGLTVTIVDVLSDAQILGNNLIYTTGGVVEDIAAPGTDMFAIFDSRLWLVDSEDRNLLWFSKQVIEATPVEMSDLFTIFIPPTTATQGSTGEITSIFPMDDKLIIGKKNAFFYINGTGPDNTGANNQFSQSIFITATVGCAVQRSVVLIPQGALFQSNKGIWLLDRNLQTSYIGAPVEDYTTSATVLSAVNVPGTNQVRFTLDSGVVLMYDYFFDQWGTFAGVSNVSACIYNSLHTFINSSGNVFQESVGTYLDGASPVLFSFKTGPLRLGELQNYQRAYFFYLLGTYLSAHQLTLEMFFDYEAVASQTVTITPTATTSGDLEFWRIFMSNQRCMALQIKLTEVYGGTPGAALTLDGLNIVCGFKKGYFPMPSANSAG